MTVTLQTACVAGDSRLLMTLTGHECLKVLLPLILDQTGIIQD